jgi:hypothetical protein
MKQPRLTRRRFVGSTAAALGSTTLAACGGGGDASADTVAEDARATALGVPGTSKSTGPIVTPAPVPAPGTARDQRPPAPAVAPQPTGIVNTSLKINGTQTGSFPFAATVLPLPGQVPSGSVLMSPDDATLRSAVLSRWVDGSAAVVVVSGTANVTGTAEQTLLLQPGTPVAADVALTPARVGQLVSAVKVDFGSLGVVNVTDFATPERIWWANAQTICARYRATAPSHGTLEAVIDIQAFATGRALVEVVVENAKMNSAAPAKPAVASYSAVVSVNGNSVATVQSAGGPEGAHTAFRAWYASTWVGGDPGLRVVQAAADLQKHPLLFKCDRNSGDLSAYAADTYAPWSTGRHRATGMGAGGDHPSIGPLPQWEASFLQSGSPAAAKAVEASALALLGWNINYRDSGTGLVPTAAQLAGRNQQSNWPTTGNSSDRMMWETAHHPAAGLMAFAARPSPVFIELAQKIAVWNATWSTGDGTGVFGYWYQTRGKAWGVRSLAHALFLTPEALPWRNGAKDWLNANTTYLRGFQVDSKAVLGFVWNYAPNSLEDHSPGTPGMQVAMWQHHYLATELHKAASLKLLDVPQQAVLDSLADWAVTQPVRWVNEQANGGWRYVPYTTTAGRSTSTMDSLPTWGQQRAWQMSDNPPAASGPWCTTYAESTSTYAGFQSENQAGATYVSYMWSALVAAVERRVPGAAQAWQTVLTGATNLEAWRNGFAGDPRWGAAPRVVTGFGLGSDAGSYANNVWTPGRDSDGRVNQVSWDLVPAGQWVTVAGTRLDGLDTQVKAAVAGWGGTTLNWDGVANGWSGFAIDLAGSRAWLTSGGHSNSFNNGIYRWDCFKMAWAVELMPSDRSLWSATYKGSSSATFCEESASVSRSKRLAGTLQPVNDAMYDELAWDGRPTARHTYSAMVYAPETNELIMVCRRLWRYSLTSGRWTYKRVIADSMTADSAGGLLNWMDGESIIGVYDEATREVLTSSAGSSSLYRACSYNTNTQAWAWWGVPWNNRANVADTRNGRKLVVVSPPETAATPYASPGDYWEYDLDTRAVTKRGSVQYAPGLSQTDFAVDNWWYDGAALCFVEPMGMYLLWTMVRDGSIKPFWLDPRTATWTLSRATFSGAVPSPNPGGNLERKCVYFPNLKAVVLMDLGTTNMSLFKAA